MRVLVTGHRGFIGSVLVNVLDHARFDVVGLDCDYYKGCDFGRAHGDVPSFEIDIRNVEFADLLSFDAVVHLADLPAAAASTLNPAVVRQISEEATVRLAACCKKANVGRFVFMSSCEVYGRWRGSSESVVDEQGPVDPVTAHGESKRRCELALLQMGDDALTSVILRSGSVYGVSPRLRLDVCVNDFVASAMLRGNVMLEGDGGAWRSLVHVEDLCRAVASVLVAPDEAVRGEVFNLVAPNANLRLIEIADLATELVPHATRSVSEFSVDEPSCRVDGSKFERCFPKFSHRYDLTTGMRQLRSAMDSAGLSPGDWRSDRYRRLPRLSRLIERREVDITLRHLQTAPA